VADKINCNYIMWVTLHLSSVAWFDFSCENGNCNNNPDREAQLFGFLDQFFFQSNEPQESPTTPVDKINSKIIIRSINYMTSRNYEGYKFFSDIG
jgi:hypothetical protein